MGWDGLGWGMLADKVKDTVVNICEYFKWFDPRNVKGGGRSFRHVCRAGVPQGIGWLDFHI